MARSNAWVAVLVMCGIIGGGTSLGAAADEHAGALERSNSYSERTSGRVFRDSVELEFFGPDEAYAWYRVRTGPESHEFVLVDTAAGRRTLAFDHARMATQLSDATGQSVDATALPISGVRFSDDAGRMHFAFDRRVWVLDRDTGLLEEASEEDPEALAFAGDIAPMDVVRPSSSGGDPTEIEILNRTDRPLDVYWHDPSGSNRHYGRAEPGESFHSSTYAGHVWVLQDDGETVAAFRAETSGRTAVVDETTQAPRRRGRGGDGRRGPRNRGQWPGNSPDGRWSVSFRDHNVVLRNRETEQEHVLTEEGTEGNAFGGGVWWSPDSAHFVVLRTEEAPRRQITLVESSPRDQLQPKTITVDYTKPGDALDHPRPYLFHVAALESEDEGGEVVQRIDDALFPNPFALERYRWSDDSSEFTFVYNQRGHQVLRLISVDAATGEPRVVIDETSPTFVCYSSKFFLRQMDATGEILWMTERDGWNHLILVDGKTGEVKNRVTSGPWVVRDVERVDDQRRQVWLRVGGIHAGEDPYHVHLIRVDFDGSNLTCLTEGDGTHRWTPSPGGRWLVDTYSRVDLPPVTVLRDAETGEMVCELERADWSALLASGWSPPERFVAKGRDGQTDIHGIIVRPTNFDAARKYPVLEAIYAGPQSSFTPKSFGRHTDLYEMAELGFIVVKLDGMGTNHRSKAFHDVCWRNLGDSGFPDRIAWMRAAAEDRPEMDLERVGIWGGSAGGQSALRALLAHGDFYDAAAADCGCHDNRMDKIWWNEQWMGWPVGPHYEEQSNVTQAHRLEGRLLLTVGELDTNVDPASTMQVAEALIRANKDFDLIVFPGQGHGAGSSPYGKRRMKEFFLDALGE